MSVPKRGQTPEFKLRIPLQKDERDEFQAFIASTGRKAGPWVRTLILQAIANETPRGVRALLTDHEEALG